MALETKIHKPETTMRKIVLLGAITLSAGLVTGVVLHLGNQQKEYELKMSAYSKSSLMQYCENLKSNLFTLTQEHISVSGQMTDYEDETKSSTEKRCIFYIPSGEGCLQMTKSETKAYLKELGEEIRQASGTYYNLCRGQLFPAP